MQALRLSRKAGPVGLGTLPLDGTKLSANASRHKAMSYERMLTAEGQLKGEIALLRERVQALLEDAERVDQEEDERFGPTIAASDYYLRIAVIGVKNVLAAEKTLAVDALHRI